MKRIYWPTANWQLLDISSLGMDKGKLESLEQTVKSDYDNINGIVVVKNGYIAYEKYFNDSSADKKHHVASVTKSIISALIGICIDKGYIESVDQKVLDFFPEYVFDDQRSQITIRHLLTMTAPYAFEAWREPFEVLCAQPDWTKYILDILGKRGELGVFKYSSSGAHLLSAIITRATGKSAREFANEFLFGPTGMQEIPDHEMKGFGFEDLFGHKMKGWVKDPSGNSTGGWGLMLSAQDMARFGFLYLNKGSWEGHQVISDSWVEESIRPNLYNYGYLWWLREEDGIHAHMALGDGGNVICCLPQKDMVVAITSEVAPDAKDRMPLIKEFLM